MVFKAFVCLSILAPILAYGQLVDDFSDGDFTDDPVWQGSTSLFIVDNGVLRSNSSGAANFYLASPQALMDATRWEFELNLNFSTSGSNYIDVFLTSDAVDLNAVQNAYFIRFGGTPDEISFYRKQGGTNTLLIDGLDGLTGASSNNDFEIVVERSSDGEWIIKYAPDGLGVFSELGTITDLAINTTAFFGFRIVQSSATGPVNNHFFDNVAIGPIPVDLSPPEVISAIATSATTIELVYSESLDPVSVVDPSNYTIDQGIGQPSNILLDDNGLMVSLTFNSALENGIAYLLSTQGVSDLVGNIASLQILPISFITPAIPTYRAVVFNELLPDPSPSNGLPELEFIELFNASDQYFDLANWKLVNTTTIKLLPSHILAPGEFVILANATGAEALADFGDIIPISSFTALTNGGDSLTLLDASGEVIDILAYSADWYGDAEFSDGGYTLEQINPFTPCTGAANWSASTSLIGGSPGAINTIFDSSPDISAPEITHFEVVSQNRLALFFSEEIDPNSLNDASFVFEPAIAVTGQSLSANERVVILDMGASFELGTQYELTVSGLSDCIGNLIAMNSQIQIQLGAIPIQGDVIFSEIYPDPNPSFGLPGFEYIEVYNRSDRLLSLAGVSVNDKILQGSSLLQPGEFAILVDGPASSAFNFGNFPVYTATFGNSYLTNAGRELILNAPSGELLDRINYNTSWYGSSSFDDGGYSLERINLVEYCRGAENWTASTSDIGGSPGMENAANSTEFDQIPPTILAALVISPNQVELIFSERCDSTSLYIAEISIDPALDILQREMPPYEFDRLKLTFATDMELSVFYKLTITGVLDCSLNGATDPLDALFGRPDTAFAGDIIINEILFNPRTGGVDFVELVNVSNKLCSLENWSIQNQDSSTQVISAAPLPMAPDQYLVLSSNTQNISQEYPLGDPSNYFQMTSLPSFNNSSGSVRLINSNNELMDQFDYSEDYHFQLLSSFKGVSLERISFNAPTNDRFNWTSAAENIGFATPGKINSQYHPGGRSTARFAIENELFSPDNDGYNDVMIINYQLEQPNYLATVLIYDRAGRNIRTIQNNTLMSTKGTISWDGLDDQQSKARIGPYIVFIEVFNTEGGIESYKLSCVLAGRF